MPDSFSNVDMQHSATHQLQIEFTGSGSEYFRIWIVNFLLMFVTFGITILGPRCGDCATFMRTGL